MAMVELPVPCSKVELLALLSDMRRRIEEDDSFEGRISYEVLEGAAPSDSEAFGVVAVYRVGNSMGQGGMRMIANYGEQPC